MADEPEDRAIAPRSPCINVCVLGVDGHCVGCLRTGDEIARWRDLSAADQWQLIDRLRDRRTRRGSG
jgi:uncharacterized protein